MAELSDLERRLLEAAGAEESPVDREEHARRVAEVVERVRGVRAPDLDAALLEQVRTGSGG